jgi:hypothetical protein
LSERFAVLLAATLLPFPAAAATFYVSPSGSDTADGASEATPWQTLSRANAQVFAPGDSLLLEGGQTFAGTLTFDDRDAGSATEPVVVSSYGAGRATISAAAGSGIFVLNTAGLTIANLVIVGAGAEDNSKAGVEFYTDVSGGTKFGHVYLDSVEVSGFRNGVLIGSRNGTSGYDDVRVTSVEAHDNQRSGLTTYSAGLYGITNVYVAYSSFHDNRGDVTYGGSSGNGLMLGGVDGAVIERTVAYGNGRDAKPGQGGLGIGVVDSNDVTLQHNEAYRNEASGTGGGHGFGLGEGTTGAVVQFNYAHDNDGAGFFLLQDSGEDRWSGNTLRYNIAENDGRQNGFGELTAQGGGGTFEACDVLGNTFFTSAAATDPPSVLALTTATSRFRFFNNLFVTSGGVPLVEAAAGQSGALFAGNDYWSSGATFVIDWEGTTHSSLEAWASASGQENLEGEMVGLSVDPRLGAPGRGGTVGDPRELESLAAYELQVGSPVVDAGLDLRASFGVDPGSVDFYGTSLPQGPALDIGAHEREFVAGGDTGAGREDSGTAGDTGTAEDPDGCGCGGGPAPGGLVVGTMAFLSRRRRRSGGGA